MSGGNQIKEKLWCAMEGKMSKKAIVIQAVHSSVTPVTSLASVGTHTQMGLYIHPQNIDMYF